MGHRPNRQAHCPQLSPAARPKQSADSLTFRLTWPSGRQKDSPQDLSQLPEWNQRYHMNARQSTEFCKRVQLLFMQPQFRIVQQGRVPVMRGTGISRGIDVLGTFRHTSFRFGLVPSRRSSSHGARDSQPAGRNFGLNRVEFAELSWEERLRLEITFRAGSEPA
jgi:hypothetical protein